MFMSCPPQSCPNCGIDIVSADRHHMGEIRASCCKCNCRTHWHKKPSDVSEEWEALRSHEKYMEWEKAQDEKYVAEKREAMREEA